MVVPRLTLPIAQNIQSIRDDPPEDKKERNMTKCPTYMKQSIDRLLEAHDEYVVRGGGDPDLYEIKEEEFEHRRTLLEASIGRLVNKTKLRMPKKPPVLGGMTCPSCLRHSTSRTTSSRRAEMEDGSYGQVRRRECTGCGHRWTTIETAANKEKFKWTTHL